MSDRLTEVEVTRVVAEVSKLAQFRELDARERLGRDQVVQILEELSLPVELLDPAMQELERRENEERAKAKYDATLAAARRRRFAIIGSSVAALVIVILFVGAFAARRSRALASIGTVEPGRITRAIDNGASLGTVARDGSEVFYRVTLDQVPLAGNLSLKCNWIDPGGRIIKQNSWETRAADKTVWATSCRCLLGPSAQPGAWRVEMLIGDRVLSQTDFKVE